MKLSDKKQKLLLEYLISSPDTFALCSSIIEPNYFAPEYRGAVKFIKDYYAQYSALPDSTIIEAETDITVETQVITKDKISYCADQIAEFCKQKAIEKAIVKSADLLETQDYGKIEKLIKDAVTMSLNRELGTSYFEEAERRIQELLVSEATQSTGWKDIDKWLFGGHVKKQLMIFAANSGGGKSIALANYCVNMMEQGFSCLYITLELSENMVSKRFDSMVTGVAQAEWNASTDVIVQRIEEKKDKLGALHIKYMPTGTNTNDIRGYLKEFELKYGYTPDVVAVDYIDLMYPTVRTVKLDDAFNKDKYVCEELRNLANDYDCYMVSASQLNRSAVGEEHHDQSMIAGGISKINTADVVITILWTDSMRASREVAFQFLKTRSSDGVGKSVYLSWDPQGLRMVDHTGQKNKHQEATDDDDEVLSSKEKRRRALLTLMD